MDFTNNTESNRVYHTTTVNSSTIITTLQNISADSSISLSASTIGVFVSFILVVLFIVTVIIVIRRRKPLTKGKRDGLHEISLFNPTFAPYETLNEENISTENRASGGCTHIDVNYTNSTDKELDWNKILKFLARNIHADSWLMLIDCLYDNTRLPKSLNFRERIRRVELDVRSRSHGTEILILEQFKSWKEAAGNNASPDVIKTTLEDMGHIDTLEEFNKYMSNPPYVEFSEEHDKQQTKCEFESDVSFPFSTFFPPPGSKFVKETRSKISVEVLPKYPQEPVIHEVGNKNSLDKSIEAESLVSVSKPDIHDDFEQSRVIMKPVTKKRVFLQTKGKADKCNTRSSNVKLMEQKTNVNRIRGKNVKVKLRRKNKSSLRITRKSVELLIQSYIQIEQGVEPVIHKLFLKSTINELVTAGIQRASALCLKYSEYREIETFETKKGDVRHFLYIGNKMHILQTVSYDKLKLYADYVLQKVSRRLKGKSENTKMYMFVDHDGIPLKNVPQENVDKMDTKAVKSKSNRNQNRGQLRINRSSTTFKRRKPHLTEDSITRKTIGRLIESYVQIEQNIKPEIHDLSTKLTVSSMVKSGIPRDSVTSLKYRAFTDIETFRTKKGDSFYFLYIGDTNHILQSTLYEKLKIYADHVREKALRRLHGTNDYIFISFDGFPFHQMNSRKERVNLVRAHQTVTSK